MQALWNLSYLKTNCQLIIASNGIEILKKAKASTDDQMVKKNIAGILYMCTVEFGLSPADRI